MENLFGEVVRATPPTNPGTKNGNPCLRIFGRGPEGAICKTCQHLTSIAYSRKYIKCAVRGATSSATTDHLAKWPACAKYETKIPLLPTVQEIADYFKSFGHGSCVALAFFVKYEANGWTVHDNPCETNHWRVGRKPMKDWKKAARSYISRYELTLTKSTKRSTR